MTVIGIGTKTEIVGEHDTVHRLEIEINQRKYQAAQDLPRRILLLPVGGAAAVCRLEWDDGAPTGCREQSTSLTETRVVHTASHLCHLGGSHLGPTCVLHLCLKDLCH